MLPAAYGVGAAITHPLHVPVSGPPPLQGVPCMAARLYLQRCAATSKRQ